MGNFGEFWGIPATLGFPPRLGLKLSKSVRLTSDTGRAVGGWRKIRPPLKIRVFQGLPLPGVPERGKGCVMKPRSLKVGDRVRVVRQPPAWGTAGYRVPVSTRRIYRLMIDRRRAVRVDEVDQWGAWVSVVVRDARGR